MNTNNVVWKLTRNIKLLWAAVLFLPGALFSQDFGLNFRSLSVFGGNPDQFTEYNLAALPWFAAPLGERGDLYLSGGLSGEYTEESWKGIPELYRFSFGWRFGSRLRLEAGRLSRGESLNLIMNGLYDGVSLEYDLGKQRLSGGVYYTGLLYKKSAYIVMSGDDYREYSDRDVYFASRRMVFTLGWEVSSLFNRGAGAELGFIGQVDLNGVEGEDRRVHSQYVLGKVTLPFWKHLNAEGGVVLGVLEDGEARINFALLGELAWLPPGLRERRLSVSGAFSSGAWNGSLGAFVPLNTIAQGKVLRPGLSGLALVELEYVTALHRTLSVEASGAYLFRTDTTSYQDPDLDRASRSPCLGGELYGGVIWAPVSDVSLTLGGGFFIPGWGRAFEGGADIRRRLSVELVLSL